MSAARDDAADPAASLGGGGAAAGTAAGYHYGGVDGILGSWNAHYAAYGGAAASAPQYGSYGYATYGADYDAYHQQQQQQHHWYAAPAAVAGAGEAAGTPPPPPPPPLPADGDVVSAVPSATAGEGATAAQPPAAPTPEAAQPSSSQSAAPVAPDAQPPAAAIDRGGNLDAPYLQTPHGSQLLEVVGASAVPGGEAASGSQDYDAGEPAEARTAPPPATVAAGSSAPAVAQLAVLEPSALPPPLPPPAPVTEPRVEDAAAPLPPPSGGTDGAAHASETAAVEMAAPNSADATSYYATPATASDAAYDPTSGGYVQQATEAGQQDYYAGYEGYADYYGSGQGYSASQYYPTQQPQAEQAAYGQGQYYQQSQQQQQQATYNYGTLAAQASTSYSTDYQQNASAYDTYGQYNQAYQGYSSYPSSGGPSQQGAYNQARGYGYGYGHSQAQFQAQPRLPPARHYGPPLTGANAIAVGSTYTQPSSHGSATNYTATTTAYSPSGGYASANSTYVPASGYSAANSYSAASSYVPASNYTAAASAYAPASTYHAASTYTTPSSYGAAEGYSLANGYASASLPQYQEEAPPSPPPPPPPDSPPAPQPVASSDVGGLPSASEQVQAEAAPPPWQAPKASDAVTKELAVPAAPVTTTSAVNEKVTTGLGVGSSVPLWRSPTTKFQIHTNPRIVGSAKPAYIAVKLPTVTTSPKLAGAEATADKALQPGAFPPSLRSFVERNLLRCEESQKAACQAIMREMISTAARNGTLFSKNWDTEPLFPLPPPSSQAEAVKVEKSEQAKASSTSRWQALSEQANSPPRTNGSLSTSLPVKQEGLWRRQEPQSGKKRKKMWRRHGGSDSEEDEGEDDAAGAGRSREETVEERDRRLKRAKRFDHARSRGGGVGGSAGERRATAYKMAWAHHALQASANANGGEASVEDMDWDQLTVRGTCQEIPKKYLRLTSAPDPSTVRPEEVLKKALTMVKDSTKSYLYKCDQLKSIRQEKSYLYKCDQLKSIRQDLTVQRIRDDFTAEVYETHGRLALEAGDLGEYNQCQAQLKGLYNEGISGCKCEFAAYGLLYTVFQHGSSSNDLLASMAALTSGAREDPAVKHALDVRHAVASENYYKFFALYKRAPNLGQQLMDLHADKMRYAAVHCMTRAYRPSLPIAFIARTLAFGDIEATSREGSDGLPASEAEEECSEWLKVHGCTLVDTPVVSLDTKASMSTLFMPEPEAVIAHGDANLNLEDFFAKTLAAV
eukprot:SM000266S09830  [mRNA]  locus=s266:50191:56978:- [translate_table: standard]